jgi:hypothetical protein
MRRPRRAPSVMAALGYPGGNVEIKLVTVVGG